MLAKIIKILIDVEGLGMEEWQEIVNFLANQDKEINQLRLEVEGLKENNRILQQQIDEENR
jgi:hypothetical protein